MKDMYDWKILAYFFYMVLSYSRIGFVYFSLDTFQTQTAIYTQKYAFRYFVGQTKTILYD